MEQLTLGTTLILIATGIVVGIINTFAGAGASVSMMIYSWLGVDLSVANATNRISVLMQATTMSLEFRRQGILNFRDGLLFSIPIVVGSVFGALYVSYINTTLFAWLLCGVLFLMLLILLFNPTSALKQSGSRVSPQWYHYLFLILIGFYGGGFHIGIGYLFLWMFIGSLGYGLMEANALKGFVTLPYTLTSLLVFGFTGDVAWWFGLIHGVGNVLGSYLAARYSQYIPIVFLRLLLIVFITLTVCYILFEKLI